jgi:hypothetical protein
MTTKTKGEATIADSPPFPTSNPVGDVRLQERKDRRRKGERPPHLVAGLLDRVRAMITRARDRTRA